MTNYELKLDTFQGPLEKLLELIERKELEITQLSLAEVTDDFVKYINSLEDVSSRVLSDFVAVAARLILIKSRAILPQLELTEEEEEDIKDLERRLKLYKEFRAAEAQIKEMWEKQVSFSREYLISFPEGFYLSQKVEPMELGKIMGRIHEAFIAITPKTESIEIKLVTLEEKIEELMRRVDKALRTSFNDIVGGRNQSEVVVLFLALLHLLKDRSIEIHQEDLFSDIQIISTKNGKRTT